MAGMDGKHIAIQKPAHSATVYYNYKQSFSIVLLGLIDANYKFIYADIGCNGRVSDALETRALDVPKYKPLPGRQMPVPFVITADDAFPLKQYIMKPFPFKNQPAPDNIFNFRLSRARRVVENVFGLLACRFHILSYTILLQPEKVITVVSAIVCLHNFLISRN
ncbi:hypothetical protein J437_LFUL005351 [Ladona fulva]|uniref:DDE Tnp4 domain-containing protein n=1 Tax=Ladona fulva TaxID=123851 RepID=A0A8K0NXH4_LADFU|nr:hypothetical protein J437_LFUL005351 [Ladona fulva]